jgi:hypothetical protein
VRTNRDFDGVQIVPKRRETIAEARNNEKAVQAHAHHLKKSKR